jgi:sulfoxide reductase heme-binding subunit YedZ
MNEALWALGRGTGVVALVAFTLTLVLGIVGRSGRDVLGVGRFGANELHRTAALTGTSLIAVHVVSLLLDPFAQLRLVDTVLPFVGSYRPLWQGLGTLAVDLLVVITVVSLIRDRVGPRVFRAVHWATYALWPIALGHALGNGTDRTSGWMIALAVACCVSVLGAVAWRLTPSYAERGMVRTPRKVAAR